MNNEQVFRVAPFSLTVWLWTLTYVIGFLYFGSNSAAALSSGMVPDQFDFVLTLVTFGILLYAWLRSIRSYHLTDKELVIMRGGPGRMHIAVDDILGAQATLISAPSSILEYSVSAACWVGRAGRVFAILLT